MTEFMRELRWWAGVGLLVFIFVSPIWWEPINKFAEWKQEFLQGFPIFLGLLLLFAIYYWWVILIVVFFVWSVRRLTPQKE